MAFHDIVIDDNNNVVNDYDAVVNVAYVVVVVC